MAGAFCFSKDTVIVLKDGFCPIKDIVIGDVMQDGSTVTATMKFNCDGSEELYVLDGIIVSGSHIVYINGKPIFVKECKDAVPFNGTLSELYCLNTSSHKIQIFGDNVIVEFADWEELDNNSMSDWDHLVRKFLNNEDYKSVSEPILNSETGFIVSSKVETKEGPVDISQISIGDTVFDGDVWTEVTGTVRLNGEESFIMGKIGSCKMSGATWIYDTDKWIRAAESRRWRYDTPVNRLVSLFTESGKFVVDGIAVRDFSDIGIKNINKTYDFTKSRL